ncbi:hypothetical protein MMC28_003629 [Mycoblastus sanguinarius]|nr:hypothetical protein [Mycoblastus sanguinarius]
MSSIGLQQGYSSDHSTDHLPRILCLHGGGSSALIQKVQTRRLQWALRDHFHFVFVNGPFEAPAGPGILPAFEGCAPYYRWAVFPFGPDENTLREQQRCRQVLRNAVIEDGGDFVGILGFSQGAREAAGLLADQEQGTSVNMPHFQFGVFLCGSHPPLSISSFRSGAAVQEKPMDNHGRVRDPSEDEIIHTPSVHVRGTLDQHLEKGRRLAKFFNPATRIDLEFTMGHHLPGAAGDTTSSKGDTDKIKEAILQAYGDMSTSEAVGA